MAGNTTISGPFGLPTGNALTGTEYIPMDQVQSGHIVTVKATAAQIAALASGGGNITPDTHPASPTIYDDEFEYGSSIDLTGARFAGASPWTWSNQGIATSSVAGGSLILNNDATSPLDLNIVGQPVTGFGTWTTKAAVSLAGGWIGMVIWGTGSYDSIAFFSESAGTMSVRVQNFASPTAYGSGVAYNQQLVPCWSQSPYSTVSAYFQIQWASGVTYLRMSQSGVPGTFATLATITPSVTYTNVGLFVGYLSACSGVFDWFRKTT